MHKIKAVIFDLDGTLANTLPLCIKAFRSSVEPLINRNVTDEEIIATFGPSEEGTIMALAPEAYDQGVADYLMHYQAYHDMCPAPFDGVKELLDSLQNKGVRIAMVTGKGKSSADVSIEKFGLSHYFEFIETGLPSGPSKPDGIEAIIRAFNNVPLNEVIYVGDAPSDIIACREVGIPIVAAAWAETAEPERLIRLNPDQIFYSVPEFSEWLLENV